jgi:hypothetical protein
MVETAYHESREDAECKGIDIKIRSTNFETNMLNPKLEILNSKQTQMFKAQNSKLYEVETIKTF